MSGRVVSSSPAAGVRRGDPSVGLSSPASAGTRYTQLSAAQPQSQDWTQKRRSEGRGESSGAMMSPATPPVGAPGSRFEGFLTGFSSSVSLAAPPWFIHHTQAAAPSAERDRKTFDSRSQLPYPARNEEYRAPPVSSQPPPIRGTTPAAAIPLTSPKAPMGGARPFGSQRHQDRIQQQRFVDVYDVTSSTNTNELAASPQPFDEKANPRSPWLAGPHQHLHRPDEPLPSPPVAARPNSAAAAFRQQQEPHPGSPWLAGPHQHLHQDIEPLPRPPGVNTRSASLEERRERYSQPEGGAYRPPQSGEPNAVIFNDRYRQQQEQHRYPSESSGAGLRAMETEEEIRSLKIQVQDLETALASAKAEAKMLSTQLQQERSLKDTAVNSARYSSLEEAMRIVQSEGIRGLERRLANERLRSFGSGDLGQPVSTSLYSSTPGSAGGTSRAGAGSGYPASSSQSVPVFMDGPSLQKNKRLQEEYQRRMRASFDLHAS
jgi:hypothetical protein